MLEQKTLSNIFVFLFYYVLFFYDYFFSLFFPLVIILIMCTSVSKDYELMPLQLYEIPFCSAE